MKEHGKLAYMKGILRSYPKIRVKPPEKRTRSEQRRVEIVESVLDAVSHMPDAQSRRKIIDLVYFQQVHTLRGAALQIPVSERTAARWNGQLMELIEETAALP
ncbi:MAG: hypothetical protein ACLUDG_09005 [Butyricicoccus sp.]